VEFGEFCRYLVTELDLPVDATMVSELSGLYDDLELDSFQALEVVIAIEYVAEVTVPPVELPELYTMGDAYRYYASLAPA
jgi:acyl carrier protein